MAAPTSDDGVKAKGTKRKRSGHINANLGQIEIDVHAPEPASKKSLRKAKRIKIANHPLNERTGSSDHVSASETEEKDEVRQFSRQPIKRSPFGIWIGNLPFFVTAQELRNFLTGDSENMIDSSDITRIHLPAGPPRNGSKHQNKGFAYIDFQTAVAVKAALNLSEKLLGGRRVLIKNSQDFQGRPTLTSKTAEAQHPPSKRIFVGNLDFDATKQDLRHHFSLCGEIEDLHVATFEDSGKCKGYAWIQFQQESSARAAMRGWVETTQASDALEADGKPAKNKKRLWIKAFRGRKLRMEYAEDKATRYKKRFGKEAHSQEQSEDAATQDAEKAAEAQSDNRKPPNNAPRSFSTTRLPEKHVDPKASTNQLSGYSVASVQKLTGAITESKGSKITFN